MQNTNKKLIMVSIIAFVIGFLVAWLIWGNAGTPTPSGEETENTEVSGENALSPTGVALPPASSGSRLVVADQAPGKSVTVSSASLDGAAWIVVREMVDGIPGSILGAQYLEVSGDDILVELLRGTVEGGRYQALLWRDNGDRLFDYEADTPIVGTEAGFTTSVVPEE